MRLQIANSDSDRHVQFTAGEYPHGVQAVSLAGKWKSRLKPYVDAQLLLQI